MEDHAKPGQMLPTRAFRENNEGELRTLRGRCRPKVLSTLAINAGWYANNTENPAGL